MTVRTADENVDGRDAGAVERRSGAGRRVHFEALVAVGDASGRGGFEAESVDVSAHGMRLRTAYLPQIGDRLVFRFEGLGNEITVEGEVLWRVSEARGGEFAVRFVDLDGKAAEAVRAMCEAAASPEPPDGRAAPRGTRVRLHIEGLGSPMRARVRGSDDAEVQVGSNLEFLRVGRALELEDVDHGVKRAAYIDAVNVDIDPATSIPQLVVALRYGAPPREVKRALDDADADHCPRPPTRTFPGLNGPLEATTDGDSDPAMTVESAPAEGTRDTDPDPDAEVPPGIRGAGSRAARAGMAAASRVGPAMALAGVRAQMAMRSMMATLQRKRAERAEAKKAALPRRMTAPPPGGALKSEGRRLVREEEPQEEGQSPRRINRKAVVMGGGLGLAAVLAVLGATRYFGDSGRTAAPEPPKERTVQANNASNAPGLPPVAGSAGDTLSADVPLFGATPLSTTEPVPATPAESADGPSAGGMSEEGDGEGEGAPGAPTEVKGASEFGNGQPVKNATVIKVKLDGPIEGLNGAAGAMGFTISLPGRRATSAASELQRKDKRIDSMQIVNNAHGAEVTIRFKDGIPPYMAKARGDRLELSLGNEKPKDKEEPKKVASKSKSGSSHKSGGGKPKKKK